MNSVDLGKNIARLRRKNGLTQLKLAEKLNISNKTVSKWESGLGYPEITMLPRLSEVLGVSVDSLLKSDKGGIVIAGDILVDIVNTVDKYPEKGMLAKVQTSTRAVGGCVPNVGIDLAKIDPELNVMAMGKIGNDENGRFLLSEMKRYGMDVSGVTVDEKAPTSSTFVVSELFDGSRTFFTAMGANAVFSEADVDIDSLDCAIFHIGYILLLDSFDEDDSEYGTKMARLLSKIQAKGIKTSIDVVSEDSDRFAKKVIPALKYCDFAILNEIEACRVAGYSPRRADGTPDIDNIRKTMEKFLEYGVRDRVIIHCPEGGYMLDSRGRFTAKGSLVLPEGYIKGSVGAGDAYSAACLYGIYSQWEAEDILVFASGAAAFNLSAPDSISGMRSKDEILAFTKSLPLREVK